MELIGTVIDSVTWNLLEFVWNFDLPRRTILWLLADFWALSVLYVAITHAMAVRNAGRSLGWFWGAILYPALIAGYILDWIFNMTIGSLLFNEMPQERLFTPRIQRWVDAGPGAGWRHSLAVWWGNRLNTFDDHIKGI